MCPVENWVTYFTSKLLSSCKIQFSQEEFDCISYVVPFEVGTLIVIGVSLCGLAMRLVVFGRALHKDK